VIVRVVVIVMMRVVVIVMMSLIVIVIVMIMRVIVIVMMMIMRVIVIVIMMVFVRMIVRMIARRSMGLRRRMEVPMTRLIIMTVIGMMVIMTMSMRMPTTTRPAPLLLLPLLLPITNKKRAALPNPQTLGRDSYDPTDLHDLADSLHDCPLDMTSLGQDE
jgi:hypothetical protein